MPTCPRCGVYYATPETICGLDQTKLVFRAPDPLVGRALVDGLVLVEAIGEGRVGRTYRADSAEGPVAVKVLFGEGASRPAFADAWLEAVRARPPKGGDRLLQASRAQRTPAGLVFAVEPFFSEGSLADRLFRSGGEPAAVAATLLHQAAEALGALHAAGRVHGRLRPTKLRLDGEVVRIGGPGPDAPWGPPDPEPPSPARDLRQLGEVGHAALTGELGEGPRPPLHLDFGGLGPLVLALSSPRPEERPSVEAVLAALQATGLVRRVERPRPPSRGFGERRDSAKPTPARPRAATPAEPARRGRGPIGVYPIAVALVAVVGGASIWWFGAGPGRESAPDAAPAKASAEDVGSAAEVAFDAAVAVPIDDAGLPLDADAGRAADAAAALGALRADAGRADAGRADVGRIADAAAAPDAGRIADAAAALDAGRPPDAGPLEDPTRRRAFERLDGTLGAALAGHPEGLAALERGAPRAWRAWSRWYSKREPLPEVSTIEATHRELTKALAPAPSPATVTSTRAQ